MSGTDPDLEHLIADMSVMRTLTARCGGVRRGGTNDQGTWDEDSTVTGHPVTVLSAAGNARIPRCQLERYFYPFMVGLYSGVHLFFIYLSSFPGLAY